MSGTITERFEQQVSTDCLQIGVSLCLVHDDCVVSVYMCLLCIHHASFKPGTQGGNCHGDLSFRGRVHLRLSLTKGKVAAAAAAAAAGAAAAAAAAAAAGHCMRNAWITMSLPPLRGEMLRAPLCCTAPRSDMEL